MMKVDKMRDELIRLAYERRDKSYDIVMTKEDERRMEELYKEREAAKEFLEGLYEDAEEELKRINETFEYDEMRDSRDELSREMEEFCPLNSKLWRNIQSQIYGYKLKCSDPNLCDKVFTYKFASDEEVTFDYVKEMASGNIEYDEEVVNDFFKNINYYMDCLGDIDCFITDKDFLTRAIDETGESLLLTTLTAEDTIKEILTDVEFMNKILDKDEENSSNFLSGEEELDLIITQLMRCENLSNDDWVDIIDSVLKLDDINACHSLANNLLDRDWNDEDGALINKIFDLFEVYSPYEIDYERDFSKNIGCISDEDLAYRYCQIFPDTKCVDRKLLEDRDFLNKLLEMDMVKLDLPSKFASDPEIVEKYISCVYEPSLDSLSIEILNNEAVAKAIKKHYNLDPNTLFLMDIGAKLEESGTVFTHFGDDLDNKAAIQALQRWGEENDYIRIGQPIKVVRIPAGTVKEEGLNIDTGGHKGSFCREGRESWRENTDTVIIDGDAEHGVKSACEALSRLGIYVPEQIVELADTRPNRVSSLDSRSGLALVRYLDGEQIFRLAEAGLLDKSLSDEQLGEYGLTEAHNKQQGIIDNAVAKIEKYTEELPNGEKIVLAPMQILAGSSIAYEMGINYYVSSAQHFDNQGNPDGVTFAITCNPGTELPNEILEYGKKLAEKYRTGEDTSNVFVHPNKQMIVAGGFKNPDFRIPGKSTYEMLGEILDVFEGKDKEEDEQNRQ